MELELNRVDYTIVGLTFPNCLKVLPSSGPKHQQKVAVADRDGIVQVFSVKKEDIQLHFKTLPGPPITSLQCSGATGTAPDKIFISCENEVRGYTKKGKLFLNFITNMTEPILSMYVYESDLLLCGKHVYNHYRDCKDIGSYLCGDCILDVVAVPLDKNRRLTSVIACEGRMLRVLEHSRVIHSIEVGSSPVVLHLFVTPDGNNHVLFGTADGQIGIIEIERSHTSYRWFIKNAHSSSTIACMDSYDMTGDGLPNLIVGRQDGSIEIYSVNISSELETPTMIYNYNCAESITAVQGGVIGNQGYDEILVSTYSGKIFGLTTEVIDKNIAADSASGNYVSSSEVNQKIIKLRSEITDLEAKVEKEREKYQITTQPLSVGVSAIPMLPLKENMVLNEQDASYTLTLELPAAIDNILLQSDVPLDLMDVEKNSAIVSHCASDLTNNNRILVVYRCQVNTNRLEMKVRTIEGQYGKLQIYITPTVQPKCCQLHYIYIKPLSLHKRCHIEDIRPFNILSLKGSFSLAEIHSWIIKCFPEVPERAPSEKCSLSFESVFTDTIVKCTYGKGEAEFKSDNISTIAILKEFLTKQATKKNIKLELNMQINDETIPHILNILGPKLKNHQTIIKSMKLLDAIHELEIGDGETLNYVAPKYIELLKNEKSIKENDTAKPSYLERLYGVITDLYIDYNKLKGLNVKSKIPDLINILDHYNLEQLKSFFQPNSSNTPHT